jgi:hypothetical protein
MCFDSLINIITAICTLALAAVAIWQDQVLNLLNPARGEIAESNFGGKEEGVPAERFYTYHVKAISLRRWRPLKGATIRFRQINRVTDAGKEETSSTQCGVNCPGRLQRGLKSSKQYSVSRSVTSEGTNYSKTVSPSRTTRKAVSSTHVL